jgi:hypothetical protein
VLLAAIGWVALIVLCIELNCFFYASPNYHVYPSSEHCFFSVFFQLIGVQFLLALFPTAYYCSNSVSLERSTRSLPLLRATPLSGWAIALGKVVSDPAILWLLLALGFPFTAVSAAIGRVGLATFVQAYALMLAAAFFTCNLGLLASAFGKTFTKRGQAGAASMVMIMVMLFMSQGTYRHAPLNSLAALSPIPFFVRSITAKFPIPLPMEINPNLNFLGAELHPFFVSFPLYLLLGIVCFVGAARRIADDDVPVLSRAQAIFAFILYEIAVIGVVVNFFHPVRSITGHTTALPASGTEPMAVYCFFALLGVVAAALISTPARSTVESALRRPGRKADIARRPVIGDAACAMPLIGLLFLLTMLGYILFAWLVVVRAYIPLRFEVLALGAAMLFFCVAIYSLLIQSCYLAPGTQSLPVAVAALSIYLMLPPIASGIMQLCTDGRVTGYYVYAVNPIYSLVRALFEGQDAYSPSDIRFFLIGITIYVSAIVLTPVGILHQMRRLRSHIDRMRRL